MKKWQKIATTVITIIAGVGIYIYFNQHKALKLIVPDLKKLKEVKLEILKDSVHIDAQLVLKNEGIFVINIDSLLLHVHFDTSLVLSEDKSVDLRIRPGNTRSFPLRLMLASSLLKDGIELLQGQDSVDIRLAGKVKYKTLFGNTWLSFNEKFTIGVPVPPRFEFAGLKLEKWGWPTLLLEASLNVINKGQLDLALTSVRYRLRIEDLAEAQEEVPLNFHLRPGTTGTVRVPIKLHINNPGKAVWKILSDREEVGYYLEASSLVKADSISDEVIPLKISKKGVFRLKK